ncbi:MAG TPA: hypothetical protein PLN54_01550 [Flavobacteriales bacterium]|nr:hypothetical protein [Flavobacteriales bacterium]
MDYFAKPISRNDRAFHNLHLPHLHKGEVEIARITNMAAVLQESIGLHAKRDKLGRIRYRLADEYHTVFDLPIRSSRDPLTIDEIIDQFVKSEPSAYDPALVPSWESRFYRKIAQRAYDRGLVLERLRMPDEPHP